MKIKASLVWKRTSDGDDAFIIVFVVHVVGNASRDG